MQEKINTVSVTLDDGRKIAVQPGTLVKTAIRDLKSPKGLDYLGALVNNEVVSLTYPLEVESEIKLLTLSDSHGQRIYRRGVCFLLAKAVRELFPTARFAIEHSLGRGFYCSLELNGESSASGDAHPGITKKQVDEIERRMHELVQKNIPIRRRKISFVEAVRQFEQEKQWDKYNILRFRNPPKIVIFWCDGFSDLAHGPMVESTGALKLFKLIPYPPGFVVLFPDQGAPTRLPPFEPQPALFQISRSTRSGAVSSASATSAG